MIDIALFAVGLLLVIVGSELLIRGAGAWQRRLSLPPFIAGLLIVGIATSLPELVVAGGAAAINAHGLAVGTLIGSVSANSLLIIGAVAVVYPLTTSRRALGRDGVVMVASALTLIALSIYGLLDLPVAFGLLAAMAFYIVVVIIDEHRSGGRIYSLKAEFIPQHELSVWLASLLVLLGAAGLVFGAGWIVESTAGFAIASGLSEDALGLSLVAIATSLPEFVTSWSAARRGQHAVAIGNVIGSNIVNLLAGIGLVAAISPAPFPPALAGIDVSLAAGGTALLLLLLITERRLSRIEGAALAIFYIAYIGWRI